jgi:hypothetical protein
VVAGAEMGIDARMHLFIRALRNWYHGCILIIDNMLEDLEEDKMLTKTVVYRMT